ncbi:hypothetical protein EAF00_005086 [Botryotinia globosa]|nr:hypothetical protein EAF00_005086 [Botryotinia globosa]
MAERTAKRKFVELERDQHEEVSENQNGDESEKESEMEDVTDYWGIDANDSDIDLSGPNAKSFHLSKFSEPSVRNRTSHYRWCGELHPGASRERVEFDSDKDLYTITFEDPKGTKLSGTFGSRLMGPHLYTLAGIKIGFGS